MKEKKYTILHLEASLGWGGQEMRILQEAEGMRRSGHQIIFAVAKKGELAKRAAAAGFVTDTLSYEKKFWPVTLFKLVRLVRQRKIQLINTHSSLDAWIGGIAGRLAGVKIIRTRHLSNPIKGCLHTKFLYRFLADFIITTCQEIVPPIAKIIFNRANCQSIPTGICPKNLHFTPDKKIAFRHRYAGEKKDFLVGMVCVMRSWKGVQDFLQAAKILQFLPEIKWIVVGGGHEATYHKLAVEYGVAKQVVFTGHLNSPYHAIAALDAFVLLSTKNEGVSQAALQAASLQVPLICTPTGGLKEVCLHEQTGLQVPVHSPSLVADAILRLYHDRELAKNLAINAQRLVAEKFHQDKMLVDLEKMYLKLMEPQ